MITVHRGLFFISAVLLAIILIAACIHFPLPPDPTAWWAAAALLFVVGTGLPAI